MIGISLRNDNRRSGTETQFKGLDACRFDKSSDLACNGRFPSNMTRLFCRRCPINSTWRYTDTLRQVVNTLANVFWGIPIGLGRLYVAGEYSPLTHSHIFIAHSVIHWHVFLLSGAVIFTVYAVRVLQYRFVPVKFIYCVGKMQHTTTAFQDKILMPKSLFL